MHNRMPYDLIQGQGQGHECLKATLGIDRQSCTGLIFTSHISLPCNIQLCVQPLYNFPLIRSETSLFVSRDTSCLNLFHPGTM